jgi:AcrR family transcriptional regulator
MTADRLRDPRERRERATRILDVAADLLLRHGYRRVTIDDVAAGANIGKGTVYLHWKTREDLFAAVFEREVREAIGELVRTLRRDPEECLPHGFARVYFLAIMRRPLLRGFVLEDAALLGKLASRDSALDERHRLVSIAYFGLLAEHGLLRDDLDAEAIGYAFQATFEGFLRAEADGPAPDALEHRADLLAQTVRRAFESGRSIPAGMADAVIELFAGLADA